MKVTRDRRVFTGDVRADGAGLVSHAGSTLLARVADKTGLTRTLSRELDSRQAEAGRAPERTIAELRYRRAVMATGNPLLRRLRAEGHAHKRAVCARRFASAPRHR